MRGIQLNRGREEGGRVAKEGGWMELVENSVEDNTEDKETENQ